MRSQIVSEMAPQLKGQGAPPNVSLSAMIAMSSAGSWVHVWMAVRALRWQRRYADLKSTFWERMGQVRKSRLAATTQLIDQFREWPNRHSRSLLLSTLLFTAFPRDHS